MKNNQKSYTSSDALPLMTIPIIRILIPENVISDEGNIVKNHASGANAIGDQDRRKLVFVSEEKMLKAKKASSKNIELDELRKTLVNAKPSTTTLEEGLMLYGGYLSMLNAYVDGGSLSLVPGLTVMESWRSFRWKNTSLSLIPFEKCCVAFNKACYELSIFKQWFKVTFSRWCILDISSIAERIKSNYIKQQKSTSSSSPSYFHDPKQPTGFTPALIEEIKQQTTKLKELSYDFYELSKKGFPTNGAWSSEFMGLCDANVCEEFSRLCLCYGMTLNHVILDKTYHDTKAATSRSMGYDAYKSGLLLCHYKEIVTLLQPTITGHVVSPRSSSYSPMKHYSLLLLIMCYVRYICDDNSTNSSLIKTGNLLSIYNYLKNYLHRFVSIESSLDKFEQNKPLMIELLNHVNECQPILEKYNNHITHNRLNMNINISNLVENTIPDCQAFLAAQYQISIPDNWIPKFPPSPPLDQITTSNQLDLTPHAPTSTPITTTTTTTVDAITTPLGMEIKKRKFVFYLCLSCIDEKTKIPKENWTMEARKWGLIDLTVEDLLKIASEELDRVKLYIINETPK